MRRRTGGVEGARARAGMAAFDREIAEHYAESFPELSDRLCRTAERLEAGEQIDSIPGWELADYVRGVEMNAIYRLTRENAVVEIERSGDCNVGPHGPCTLDHECYREV